ncbi:MAG: acetyl-CoA acetyltransferase [Gammaproteobacteria bacterium]|nr:MAG: acetyl-CoA acetyltransferase [Gammaproteobacteria bacterium]
MTNFNLPDNTPVIVGVGDIIDKRKVNGPDPLTLLGQASELAFQDSGIKNVIDYLDAIGVVRFSVDFSTATNQSRFGYSNFPRSLANKIGVKKDISELYSGMGGNAPQVLLQEISKKIHANEIHCALISGGEVLQTMISKLKSGEKLNWEDSAGGKPEIIGINDEGFSEEEKKHYMDLPSNVYPIFANAIRSSKSQSSEEHLKECSELFSKFSKVASLNPKAWFPKFRTPEEIEEISDSNRLVGFPYTKYLNSMIRVNMASSLVVMSEKLTKELKIPQNKKVYIHGSCVLNDIWNVSKRPSLNESPAIRECGKEVLSQAGISLSEISFLDIYSCFPSAVQIAQKELSLDSNDDRPLTVTGGLPYFGGPGNAYTMFSSSEMVKKLRSNPNEYGMVTANSWFLTKHAINIFSCKPPQEIDWEKDFIKLQSEINSREIKNFNTKPNGLGKVISYTIVQGRKNLEYGIVIGELEDKSKFIANILGEQSFLKKLTENELLGIKGEVKHASERNIFKPLF